jgi:hypothetical protein
MDQCSIYQMSDEISYSTQTPAASSHVLANNHHYKHEILQPSHTHQGLRFQLQSQTQQIQNSNYHILSRHYLGQHPQYHQHYQHHQHAAASGRQHMSGGVVSASMPLNASKSKEREKAMASNDINLIFLLLIAHCSFSNDDDEKRVFFSPQIITD